MRVDQFHPLARLASRRRRLGFLHRIEHRVEQVQRHHHEHRRQRVRALQFPGDAGGVRGDLLGARLRIDAVGFDVLLDSGIPQRVRIGIKVGQVRPFGGAGFGEDQLGCDFQSRPDRLRERIGGLHRNVHHAVFVCAFLGVQDHRHLRQSRDGIAGKLLPANAGNSTATTCGFSREQRAPQFDRKLQTPRRYREVEEAAPAQAPGVRNGLVGHTAGPPRRAS